MVRAGARRVGIATLVLGLTFGCKKEDRSERRTPPDVSPTSVTAPSKELSVRPAFSGDAEKGKELVEKLECHRCHEGTGLAPMPREKHCITCHEDIMTGRFRASSEKLKRWRPHVVAHRDTPSLAALGARLEPEWVVKYLLSPRDLRPHLVPTMPRLAMTEPEARDITAYLTRDAATAPVETLADASLERGRAVYEAKRCEACHAMTGAAGLDAKLDPNAGEDVKRGASLAPDLAVTRDRFRVDALVSWLVDPIAMKPGTRMPAHGLTKPEARDLAAFVLRAELAPPAKRVPPAKLPPLTRKVTYAEVHEKVLGVTCQHCHIDPKLTGGDGGPGNSGGFGFPPRKLDLSSRRAIDAGYVASDGQHLDLFSKTPDGASRLVASLWARHAEDVGEPAREIRGMPLGLPPLAPEEIQLVESWIAQGRPM